MRQPRRALHHDVFHADGGNGVAIGRGRVVEVNPGAFALERPDQQVPDGDRLAGCSGSARTGSWVHLLGLCRPLPLGLPRGHDLGHVTPVAQIGREPLRLTGTGHRRLRFPPMALPTGRP